MKSFPQQGLRGASPILYIWDPSYLRNY